MSDESTHVPEQEKDPIQENAAKISEQQASNVEQTKNNGEAGGANGSFPSQDAFNEFNQLLNQKDKRKKMLTVVKIVLVALLVVVTISIAGSRINLSTSPKKIDSAVEQYRANQIDYVSADTIIQKYTSSHHEKISVKAKEAKKTIIALKTSKDHYSKAEDAFKNNDYKTAVDEYRAVLSNDGYYEAAQELAAEALILWKNSFASSVNELVKADKLTEAKALVLSIEEYDNSQEITDIKNYLDAEEAYQNGQLNTAKELFQKLPEDLKFNGVSVKARLNALEEYALFVKMCGKWKTTSFNTATYTLDGKINLNIGNSGKEANYFLTVTCKINANGSVSLKLDIRFESGDYRDRSCSQEIIVEKANKELSLELTDTFCDNNLTRYEEKDESSVSFTGNAWVLACKIKTTEMYISSRGYTTINTYRYGKRVETY